MPVATMIAGPNGSGKSTLYNKFSETGLHLGEYYNADDIARNMSLNTEAVGLAAQQQVRELREKAVSRQIDYCWETVMSHISHVEHLQFARDNGFETRLFYVALEDPVLNVHRVAERVVSGGHDVPQDRIHKRYYRSINNLSAAMSASDHGRIFDNSSKDSPFNLIAQINDRKLELNFDWFNLPRWFIPALVDLNAR